MEAHHSKKSLFSEVLLYCTFIIYNTLKCNTKCLLKGNDCNITKWSLFRFNSFQSVFCLSSWMKRNLNWLLVRNPERTVFTTIKSHESTPCTKRTTSTLPLDIKKQLFFLDMDSIKLCYQATRLETVTSENSPLTVNTFPVWEE